MPPTTCPAFTKNATPCTAFGHTNGYCGRHAPMRATPERLEQFDRDQVRLRARWQRTQNPEPVPAVVPEPVAPPAATAAVCGHMMTSGRACGHAPQFPDGKCRLHHNMLIRRAEDDQGAAAIHLLRERFRVGATVAQLDALVEELRPTVVMRFRNALTWNVDNLVMPPYYNTVRRLARGGGDAGVLTTVIQGWIALGMLNERRANMVARHAEALLEAAAWQANLPPARRPIPAHQREAQLAADTQNVHTTEITKQMKESLDMLCAVEVPNSQKETVHEMRDSWRRMGKPEAEIKVVYQDVSTWWNKNMIYSPNDKLYRRSLRGLWWTIKSYKGEVREELEKRLWDECRDACLPYSVCTQGHLARLSNVMVGFDDAFAQPVAVGEILQQKMAAIAAMDVDTDKQVELAKAVLAELKVPEEKHADWLAAF